jgi:hypothetical protein
MIGAFVWAIGDGWIPPASTGPAPEMTSHDTACMLNPNDKPAEIAITVYFRDREPADPAPLEHSIEWLTCAIASRLGAVMLGWPGAAQDRLLTGDPHRATLTDVDTWQIRRKPVLGGLINEYTQAA